LALLEDTLAKDEEPDVEVNVWEIHLSSDDEDLLGLDGTPEIAADPDDIDDEAVTPLEDDPNAGDGVTRVVDKANVREPNQDPQKQLDVSGDHINPRNNNNDSVVLTGNKVPDVTDIQPGNSRPTSTFFTKTRALPVVVGVATVIVICGIVIKKWHTKEQHSQDHELDYSAAG